MSGSETTPRERIAWILYDEFADEGDLFYPEEWYETVGRVLTALAPDPPAEPPRFVFDCPACREPWATIRGHFADIHAGALFTCNDCGADIEFEARVSSDDDPPEGAPAEAGERERVDAVRGLAIAYIAACSDFMRAARERGKDAKDGPEWQQTQRIAESLAHLGVDTADDKVDILAIAWPVERPAAVREPEFDECDLKPQSGQPQQHAPGCRHSARVPEEPQG